MNILRTAALVGLSTLVLSACANNPYASSRAPAYHGGVYTQHPSTYPSQPRVIIAQQPHRQVYSQGSRIYTQPHQVQQYNYYPGHQYQQPRHHQQQRPNHYQHPRYTQQRNPYINKYDTRPQHQRPNHQRYEQYQRPDYSAQHRQNRAQRIQQRETWSQNRERITQQPQRQHYQQRPGNNNRNYGSGIRQQRSTRY
ncbi:MAG: hypothetical protein V7751_10055 [Pseudoalteromonas distincta]